MIAKEKAEELVLKFLRIDNNTKEWINIHIAKQFALIAVEEILSLDIYQSDQWFYQAVKEEIEKL